MEDPKIKTKVVHSLSKNAWNVIGTKLGAKYKIARVPYVIHNHDVIDENNKQEALTHANYISHCFNNSDIITTALQPN